MTDEELNLIASILEVKASGIDQQVVADLQLPDGKSIAELLDDQKEKNNINK
jgi:hypothetical protein